MREILFRGKMLDTGAWVEGAFCLKDCDDPFGELQDRPSIIKYDPPHDGYWFRVIPETVGQLTGLFDKNGMKIFEGDVVRFTSSPGFYSYVGEVVFHKGAFCIKYKPSYEAAIRKAQADNDMERAQALYDAAKAEEAQLLELQKQGAQLLKDKRNDMSGYNAIANGETIPRDTAGETWDGVLRNEEAVNAVYDAQLESQLAQLYTQHEEAVSKLDAQRTEREKQTDEKLTDAYVASLRGAKNSGEMQGAYGSGSGAAAQGRLARDIDLQDTLTDIRKGQVDAEGAAGVQALELGKGYGQGRQQAQYDADLERARALFDAAENEEQILVGNQQFVGEALAKKGDYSMLAQLYGLTEEQARKLKPSGRTVKKSGSKPGPDDDTETGTPLTETGTALTKGEQAALIHQSVAKGEITQNQAQALLTQLDRKYPKKET